VKPTERDSVVGLSLDLSKTRTGLCIWGDQRPIRIVSWEFKDVGDTGALVASFRHRLATAIPPTGVDWVAVEDVRPVSKHHMEQHFGMLGALAEICYRRSVPLLRATSGEVKKILTGKGNADKEAMVTAARDLYPDLNVRNHDEADALAVGMVAVARIDWAQPLTPAALELAPF
jgi:Holliday junction resolvasome RuvABC endonuclease subunit